MNRILFLLILLPLLSNAQIGWNLGRGVVNPTNPAYFVYYGTDTSFIRIMANHSMNFYNTKNKFYFVGKKNIQDSSSIKFSYTAGHKALMALFSDNGDTLVYSDSLGNLHAKGKLIGSNIALGYTPENVANKNQVNGYAGLDGSGKLYLTQLPLATMTFMGTWDVLTNTPTLSDGTGTNGRYYICTPDSGSHNFGHGSIYFALNDFAVYSSATGRWQKITGADAEPYNNDSSLVKMNSIKSAGTSGSIARADHIHPHDTTKLNNSHTINGHALYGSSTTISKSDVGLGNVTNDAQIKKSDTNTYSATRYYIANWLSASSPLHYYPLLGTFTIQNATSGQTGALSSADWSTFNSKISLGNLSATSPLIYNNGTGAFSMKTTPTFTSLSVKTSSDSSTYSTLSNGYGSFVNTKNKQYFKGILGIGDTTFGTGAFIPTLGVFSGVTTSNYSSYFVGTINDYFQLEIKNKSTGNKASTDIVCEADNGDETTNYVDFGINGSAYSQAEYGIGGANDGYLYSATTNLAIGTKAQKNLLFHTGGTADSNSRMLISGTTGNVRIGNALASSSTAPLHKLVINTNEIGARNPNVLNIVDCKYNKNRLTLTQAIDTSVFNVAFTSLGKPQLTIKGIGTTLFATDSTGLITSAPLTASRVLVSDASNRITASSVTTTTLGYLDATSSVQTQLNAKQTSLGISEIKFGTSNLGSSAGGLTSFSVSFGYTFASTPTVAGSFVNTSSTDRFSYDITNIIQTGFTVHVYRLDSAGGSWGQTPQFSWIAVR